MPKDPKKPLDLPENYFDEPQNADLVANLFDERRRLTERFTGRLEKMTDTSADGRPFLDGEHSLFGYDRVVVNGGVIIALKSSRVEKPELRIGMKVQLVGDSQGYIPSGHGDGDQVEITDFAEPFHRGNSDRIIRIEGLGKSGWIKPSNVSGVIEGPKLN